VQSRRTTAETTKRFLLGDQPRVLDAPASAAFDDQRAFIERDSGQPGDDVLAIAFESGVDLVPFAE
jgi:hypothetical protein